SFEEMPAVGHMNAPLALVRDRGRISVPARPMSISGGMERVSVVVMGIQPGLEAPPRTRPRSAAADLPPGARESRPRNQSQFDAAPSAAAAVAQCACFARPTGSESVDVRRDR